MHSDNSQEFSIAIGALFESFGREATTAALHGYWMGLGDIEIHRIQHAVVEAIRTSDRLPTPVELRRLAGEKSPDAQAMAAWDDAVRAVQSLGPYKHVNFADRFINATIRNLGGWSMFISRFTDAEAEKWLRLEFIKGYRAFSSSRVAGEICEPLSGLSQAAFTTRRLVDETTGETRLVDVLGEPEPIVVKCSTPTESNLPRMGSTQ